MVAPLTGFRAIALAADHGRLIQQWRLGRVDIVPSTSPCSGRPTDTTACSRPMRNPSSSVSRWLTFQESCTYQSKLIAVAPGLVRAVASW